MEPNTTQNPQDQHPHPEPQITEEQLTTNLLKSINTYIQNKLKIERTKPNQPSPPHYLTQTHIDNFSIPSSLPSLTDEINHLKQENANLIANTKELVSQLYEITAIRKNTEDLFTLIETANANVLKVKSSVNEISKNMNIIIPEDAQNDKDDETTVTPAIRGVEHIIHINNIAEGYVYSLLELSDKRIATGSQNGTISICVIDYEEETWSQAIKLENAHKGFIFSLCELKHNVLLSSSNDSVVKMWKISESELTLTNELNIHSSTTWKIITLTNNRWASCSTDHTVKIFSNNEPYDTLSSLVHADCVYSIIQLKNKEILVSSCGASSIDFWDLTEYQKEYTLKGIYSRGANHMIELQNGFIAVSSEKHGKPILIIDPIKHAIVKEITEEGYIPHSSQLCIWGDMSFFYAGSGCLLQISLLNYKVIFKSNSETQLRGNSGIIATNGGKYLIIDNDDNGVEIFEIY